MGLQVAEAGLERRLLVLTVGGKRGWRRRGSWWRRWGDTAGGGWAGCTGMTVGLPSLQALGTPGHGQVPGICSWQQP